MEIRFATTEEEILQCLEVVQALRPHITGPEELLQRIREMQQEGYKLLYAAVEEDGQRKVVAIAGFRPLYKLHGGRTYYIDDLSTLPGARGKGYGGQLLDHIHCLAWEDGKNVVELDSGYHRNDAHRLYLNKKYVLASHHFSFKVPR